MITGQNWQDPWSKVLFPLDNPPLHLDKPHCLDGFSCYETKKSEGKKLIRSAHHSQATPLGVSVSLSAAGSC